MPSHLILQQVNGQGAGGGSTGKPKPAADGGPLPAGHPPNMPCSLGCSPDDSLSITGAVCAYYLRGL